MNSEQSIKLMLQRLDASGRRSSSKCGAGTTVWRAWGHPNDQPVVLLHGGSGSWTHWVRNIDILVISGHYVIAPDMPGFGESSNPPDGQDADILGPWLERGISDLIGSRSISLVGFSFGGLVAGLWSSKCPERVAQLILVGAPGLSDEPFPKLDLRSWMKAQTDVERFEIHKHNLLQLMLAQESTANEVVVALHGRNVERDRMLRRRLMFTSVLKQALPNLKCKVTGIWGSEDVMLKEWPDLLGDVLPLAPLFRKLHVLKDSGHWVQFEKSEEFNSVLIDSLK